MTLATPRGKQHDPSPPLVVTTVPETNGSLLHYAAVEMEQMKLADNVHGKCHASPVHAEELKSTGSDPVAGVPTGNTNVQDGVPGTATLAFAGTLEELIAAVAAGAAGTVIDLQSLIVQSESQPSEDASAKIDTVECTSDMSPRSSSSLVSVDSMPSEVSLNGIDPAVAGHGAPFPTASPCTSRPLTETAIPEMSSSPVHHAPRVLKRHQTSQQSKELATARKNAGRSNHSMPLSLASSYDSKEIVTKALSHASANDSNSVAFVLRGSGVTVRNGTIKLPINRFLLVLQAQGIVLEDLVITGPGRAWDDATSFPLLHMEGSEVELTRVQVSGNESGHGMTLGAGCDVRMAECALECNDLSGVMAGGVGCRLRASRCTFNRNLQDGAIICRGCSAEFDHCELSFNEMLGLENAFAGARAVLRSCAIEKNMEHGVSAYSGAQLQMEDCKVSKSHRVGVSVLDDATSITLRRCGIYENRHEGLLACQGVKVDALDCKLSLNRMGVEASGADTVVKLEGCELQGNTTTNITVNTAALVVLKRTACVASKGKGLAVLHPGSRLLADASEVSGSASTGVHVSKMASALMTGCKLLKNAISGVHVTDSGSSMTLEGCSLSNNQTIGIFVNKAGDATLKDCEITNNGSTGSEVRDRQSRMLLEGCKVWQNRRVGVYSHSAAVATLVACSVQRNGVKALLVGGRENVEMGGGIIEYDVTTKEQLQGDIMVRHSGRALSPPTGALTRTESGTSIRSKMQDASASSPPL